MKKLLNWKIFFLVVFFLAGITYRFSSIYPLNWDTDSRTITIQAYKILKGYRPIFFPGQAWMGMAGTYILALMFKFLGVSTLTIGIFSWLMSALFMLVIIFLAYRFFGLSTALLTSLFLLIPIERHMYWAGHPRPDYELCFVIVPLILLLTYSLIRRFKEKQPLIITVFMLGFLSGLGFWTNMASGPAVIVSFLLLVFYLKMRFLKHLLFYYVLGGILGFSPVIYYNLVYEAVIFGQTSTFANLANLHKIIYVMFTTTFPRFWGILFTKADSLMVKGIFLGFLFWIIFLYALFGYQGYLRWKKKEDVSNYLIVSGYFLVHLFIASASSFGSSFELGSIQYIIILHSVAFIIPAVAVTNLANKKLKILFLLPFFIYSINNFFNTVCYPQRFYKTIKTKGLAAVEYFPNQKNPFLLFCQDKGLTCGYYGKGIQEVECECMDRVTCAQFYQEVYISHALKTDSAEKIFWIYAPEEKNFRMLNCTFKKTGVGRYNVVYDFKKELFPETLITDYKIDVSENKIEGNFIADRNIDTLWNTTLKRRDGKENIVFKFEQLERIHKIVVIPHDHITSPSSLSIQVSTDANKWETLFETEGTPPIFWSVFHPFIKIVKPRLEIVLPESREINYCKMVIDIRKQDLFPVAIAEVYIYRQKREQKISFEELNKEVEKIISYVNQQDKNAVVIADHWFENYFKLAGRRVEFISNSFINNCRQENPQLKRPLPVDFSQPSVIITRQSHTPLMKNLLKKYNLEYNLQEFTLYDVFTLKPAFSFPDLYWNGLDLNELVIKEKGKRYAFAYPLLNELFKEVTGCEYFLGNKFQLTAYKIKYAKKKKVVSLRFEISPLVNLEKAYYMFIHFCDSQGRILFQGDFRMENLAGSTNFWAQGRRVILVRNVSVPADLAGEVNVKVGIWHPESNQRLTVNSKEGDLFIADSVYIE